MTQLLKEMAVVPSKMNPVADGDNQFAELFKAMPAARIGKMEDIAGAVLYLSSQAGVSRSALVVSLC
jgi:phenylacetate 2-hydroxylase